MRNTIVFFFSDTKGLTKLNIYNNTLINFIKEVKCSSMHYSRKKWERRAEKYNHTWQLNNPGFTLNVNSLACWGFF